MMPPPATSLLNTLSRLPRDLGRTASASSRAPAPSISSPLPVSPCSRSICSLTRPLFLRERVRESNAGQEVYTLENPLVAAHWPRDMSEVGQLNTSRRMKTIMQHLHVEEIQAMKKMRTFIMPRIAIGDLVEVKYELSRSQQTFAVFQGYCCELRRKRSASSMVLKNTYDGVGVEQLIPLYNPRLLEVRLLKQATILDDQRNVDRRHKNRNYRYAWKYWTRGKWQGGIGAKSRWWAAPIRPGTIPLEPRMRKTLGQLRRVYQMQRHAAGLPPYIFPGPYHITRRQTREVRAEMERRMRVYAWDDRRKRIEKKRKLRKKHEWTRFKIARVDKNSTPVKDRLSGHHTLNHAIQ